MKTSIHREMRAEYDRWMSSSHVMLDMYRRPKSQPLPSRWVGCRGRSCGGVLPYPPRYGWPVGGSAVWSLSSKTTMPAEYSVRWSRSQGRPYDEVRWLPDRWGPWWEEDDWISWERDTGFPAGGCVMWRGLMTDSHFSQTSERWLMTHDSAGAEELWLLPQDWSWSWGLADYDHWRWDRNRIRGEQARTGGKFSDEAHTTALLRDGYSPEGAAKIVGVMREEWDSLPVLRVAGPAE